jgi:hypothetical protein
LRRGRFAFGIGSLGFTGPSSSARGSGPAVLLHADATILLELAEQHLVGEGLPDAGSPGRAGGRPLS